MLPASSRRFATNLPIDPRSRAFQTASLWSSRLGQSLPSPRGGLARASHVSASCVTCIRARDDDPHATGQPPPRVEESVKPAAVLVQVRRRLAVADSQLSDGRRTRVLKPTVRVSTARLCALVIQTGAADLACASAACAAASAAWHNARNPRPPNLTCSAPPQCPNGVIAHRNIGSTAAARRRFS